MLPHEIEPFAQAHMNAVGDIRNALADALNDQNTDTIEIPREMAQDWFRALQSTQNAFYRFQVCMIDEHRQKDRMREAVLNCRLHHK